MEEEIVALLRARNTLLWIRTKEEARVETKTLLPASAGARYLMYTWDCKAGLCDPTGWPVRPVDGKLEKAPGGYAGAPPDPIAVDPEAVLSLIATIEEKALFVLRDLDPWLRSPTTMRALKSLARALQNTPAATARSVAVLTTSNEVPSEIPMALVIDWPLPDRAEVGQLFDSLMESVSPEIRNRSIGSRDKAIDAAVGLTYDEAGNCYAKSIVLNKALDPALVVAEKKKVISREKLLEWYDPDPRGMEAIGGLDLGKRWLEKRLLAFSKEAREFGLPSPKGIMLAGISGCGKSLMAKCVASAWQMPLLRLDMGAIKSKFVGESEQNIRGAFRIAEAVNPCILWADEIEKSLAGSQGQQGDGGVSSDALGALLNWMQERQGSVFVIATANDVSNLPPELLRKGRFDELFFVDLPTRRERAEIMVATLVKYNRPVDGIDLPLIAAVTDGFTGAEIAALVPESMFSAFADGRRPINSDDLVAAAATVVPLSKTAAEKITELRKWAAGRARPISLPEEIETAAPTQFRKFDM